MNRQASNLSVEDWHGLQDYTKNWGLKSYLGLQMVHDSIITSPIVTEVVKIEKIVKGYRQQELT